MKDLRKIHAHLIKTGLSNDKIAASRVLSFCCSPSGDLNYAYRLFSRIDNPNLFIWNTIIRAFSQSSTPENAIHLFIEMLVSSQIEPSELTYPSVFKAYAHLGLAHSGTQLHGRVIKLGLQYDQYVRNNMIYMYASSGFLGEARRLFHERMDFDVVTWNLMIMGLAKCGEVGKAKKLFDEMPRKSTVTWNSMISGYVRNGKLVEALKLFGLMQDENIRPSEFTMVSLLNASARLGAIRQGEWVHEYMARNEFEMNTIVVTAIIDMYCKCGSIEKALKVFETSPNKGLSCWNSMILGLATNGCNYEAIQLFSRLISLNLNPDDVTFIGVLTACNHPGLVDKAREYFSLMTRTYKIKPSVKHFTCMVDVLGGAGLVEEAEELIESMPMNPDAIVWSSLLSACRKHGNIKIAENAAKQLLVLDPRESCGYVLMCNVLAASRQYEEAMKCRLSMKGRQVKKDPGCSLIEVNGEVQEFVASGTLHDRAEEIYLLLDELGMML